MKNIRLDPGRALQFWTTTSKDNSSFEDLALPLFDSLYNFARWLARNQTDAEDIVQETYLKAWRSFSSFQQGTNFRAWMFRILRNTFLTSRSGFGVTNTVPLGPEEDVPNAVDTKTPETILLCQSDIELVRDALKELPNYYREIVLLCDVEGLTYQEISETLAIPLGTVMSRLSRARNALRGGLEYKRTGGTGTASPPPS